MSDNDLTNYSYPNNTPVVALDCREAFDKLTSKEKLYAHHLARASWYGSAIVTTQISAESPLIFVMLLKVFENQSIDSLRKLALEKTGFSEEEFEALLVYSCAVFENQGNYKSFGSTKIVPLVSREKVEGLFKESTAWSKHTQDMEFLWTSCSIPMFSLAEREKQLGLGMKGITTYFSSNCTEQDSQVINKFLEQEKIDPYNTRAFKTLQNGKTAYEIRFAAVEEKVEGPTELEGCLFYKTYGDYQGLLQLVNEELRKAQEYVSNEFEHKMLEHYINSFHSGLLNEHKDGSRLWVKNQKPAIETYIGFIETYTDPAGLRGEFEGFVAVVNKDRSRVFENLVKNAEVFLPMLPWPSSHEKNKFLQPDFTALDVVAFGGGLPAGINIPNYDEVRQNEGFKNVSLNNSIQAHMSDKKINFVSTEDEELLVKHRSKVFELQVGLHELLGHGSGKLFFRKKDGTFNFNENDVIDPLTKQKITSWYEDQETYDKRFGPLGSAFEECRAECVGLYLCLEDDVTRIFIEDSLIETYQYCNWLELMLAGFGKGLEMYRPETKSWLQAHCHARYVIGRVLLEHGDGIVTVKEQVGTDGKPDLRISIDRTKLKTSGREALGDFLLKLQAYKSTGNIEAATKLFDHYGSVTNDGDYPFLRWRDIAISRKKPRKLILQPNTFIKDNSVELVEYPTSFEGHIQSWVQKFKDDRLDDILIDLWKKDQKHFNY